MDEAERRVSERSGDAGIGVGMSPDYGAAQHLYVVRGYVPDGKGLTSNGRPVRSGDEITVDDGLVLYLTKTLAEEPSPKSSSPWASSHQETSESLFSPLLSNVVEPCSSTEHPCG